MSRNWDYDQDYYERRRKRQVRKSASRLLVLVITVVAILAMAWMTSSIIRAASGQQKGTAATSGSAAMTPIEVEKEPEKDLPEVDNTAWNKVGPVEQTINTEGLVTPDYRMIAQPDNGRVEMSYFDDVTFIGDSLTQGLQIYSQGIPNASYCAYKGVSIKAIYDGSIQTNNSGKKEVPMKALKKTKPGKIYIQLGANNMVSTTDDEVIIAYYAELLDAIHEKIGEDVDIYIQSLAPVTIDNSPGFDINRFLSFNNLLAKLAFEKGVHFIDLMEPMAGEDGYLREDFAAADGYHMTPKGYAAWVDYLVTHTAYDPDYPYLEGSYYYRQAEKEKTKKSDK